MHDNKNTYVWGRLVSEATLTSVLTALDLPWDYTVLAAARAPTDTSKWFVLLEHQREHDRYVVYRVDPANGSCHGGSYVSSLVTAYSRFYERLAGILADAQGTDESAWVDGAEAAREADERTEEEKEEMLAQPASLDPEVVAAHADDCRMGLHSWSDATGRLTANTKCAYCGELYGHPD